MSDADRRAYDAHMDDIMVQNDVLSTAKLEGLAEGRAEGIKLTARNLKAMGLSVGEIKEATGLSEDEINGL